MGGYVFKQSRLPGPAGVEDRGTAVDIHQLPRIWTSTSYDLHQPLERIGAIPAQDWPLTEPCSGSAATWVSCCPVSAVRRAGRYLAGRPPRRLRWLPADSSAWGD